MSTEKTIDFGAVYFRYSAPAEQDWEKDYKKAAEDGITHFRHWFPWAAIETSPGVFNWEPYDKLIFPTGVLQKIRMREFAIRMVIRNLIK